MMCGKNTFKKEIIQINKYPNIKNIKGNISHKILYYPHFKILTAKISIYTYNYIVI